MGSTFEETVFDFDLNFLQHSSNNVLNDCRIEKQKKAILVAKKKTIATDSLIKKYYGKREQLEQTEVLLMTAKEECKQVCIDYKLSLEKCENLEKDIQLLRNENKELQSNCVSAQNQVEAIKSHAHQLQVLVKEHETVIEALKIESQLEKNNVKDYEESLSNLQKENATLLKDLCLIRDIALGKKKLLKRSKLILQKYDLATSQCVDDTAAESSGEETDLFDSSPPSPLFTFEAASKNEEEQHKSNDNEVSVKKDTTRLNEDLDSDFSNEIVSEDTGRGSSLAFSDGDKCFNSPDYFCNDSPFGPECNKSKERRVFIDSCTSPITLHEYVHIATSPLLFDDEALLTDSNTFTPIETDSNTEYFITDYPLSTEIVTIKEKKRLVDVGTSTDIDNKMINVSTSPVAFERLDSVHKELTHSATSPIPNVQNCSINKIILLNKESSEDTSVETAAKILDDALPCIELRHTTVQNLSSQCEIEIIGKAIEEKICLEKNNSNNLCSENSNDCEIEMILNSMRLTEKIITPIPKTPVKLIKDDSQQILSPIKQLAELPKEYTACPDAVILREENKILQTSIADLSKEVMNIKCILKNQHLMPETPKKHACVSNKRQSLNSELFGDCSQDAIYVNLDNNEQDSNSVNNSESDKCAFTSVTINKEVPISSSVRRNSIQEPVIQIEKIMPKDCHLEKDLSSPTKLSNNKSRKTSLSKETPTVEINVNTNLNTNEPVPLLETRKTIENNLIIEDEIDATLVYDNTKEYIVLSDKKSKNIKCKKLSRLEKFRKKLLPKSKIKRINAPICNLHSKTKPSNLTKNKKPDAELLMNNKSAYEKALKVMTELKLKKTCDEKESLVTKNKSTKVVPQVDNLERKDSDNNRIDLRRSSKDELYNNVGNIEIKQPVVCLSQLKLNNTGDKEKLKVVKTPSPKKSERLLLNTDSSPTKNIINTRSRSKINQDSDINVNNSKSRSLESTPQASANLTNECNKTLESRRRLKRVASDTPTVECKRVLRSTNVREMFVDQINAKVTILATDNNLNTQNRITRKQLLFGEENENLSKSNEESEDCISNINTEQINVDINSCPTTHPRESILCKMIDKYGKRKIKYSAKKVPDDISNAISKKLEDDIAKTIELPADKAKSSMNKLVDEIQHSWNFKNFLAGFMKYLTDPTRKRELFNKVSSPPAPPMTKSEQILLFVIRQLEISTPNTVSMILTQIEYILFHLNRTPEFDIIESLSHFYSLLCRYFGLKNRLRLFLMDAMYCLQYKVVPLIKQCLDVWMHVLPLAHMGIAKTPLVTCLVYLLHFYKCEDKYNRIQDIRLLLNKKYFYQITDWNETKILEMFRNSIKELRDIKVEKKMLRMAFIILAKRQGPKWCQKNIIKNMLIPMIEKDDVPIRIKQFCVELLGPLLKPYPIDMKVHCEIVVNQLLDMVDHKTPDKMKEAIFTSLIYMNKHNQNRVTHSLLSWSPRHVSLEFEELMRDYVQEKALRVWKGILSRTSL